MSAVTSVELLHQEDKETTRVPSQSPFLLFAAQLKYSSADDALVAVRFILIHVQEQFTPLHGGSDQSHAVLLEQLGPHLVHSLIFVGM